jgi:hypothetical protein
MASATDTTLTMPGEVKVTTGPWIIVQLPKCVLALTRRQFLEGLQAGKRWTRRRQFAVRTAQAEEDRCRP